MIIESDLVAEEISSWRSGRPPDAAKFLSDHPSVGQDKSLVLDLAYAEYCLRQDAGEKVTASIFCDRFPTYRGSLARMLEVHELLANEPALAQIAGDIDWPQAGQEFCGFALKRELGRGAFSRVYLATEPALGDRQVAVKLTWAGPGEAKTLGKLSHSNVVPIYSVQHDADTGLSLVCMPYLGGATLSDLVGAIERLGTLPARDRVIAETCRSTEESEAGCRPMIQEVSRLSGRSYVDAVVDIGVQLAEALAYTHSHGVLHGDLKPSNVLLIAGARPMLLDFNLSTDSTTIRSRVGGTLPYMAPEQIVAVFFSDEAARGQINERSDIFSLGAVLYQLLSGRLPFWHADGQLPVAQAATNILERQLHGAEPISRRNPAVDPQVDRIIRRCLDPQATGRPKNAQELADELRYFLSRRYRAKRWASRHRRALGAMVAATIIGLAAIGSWLALRPPFSVRAYESGLADYDRGNFQAAVEEFTAAAKSDAPSAQLLFARGMASVKLADYESAIADYRAANRLCKSGAIDAMLGYCYSFSRSQWTAVSYSQAAIESGFSSAAVLNNLGYNYLQQRQFADAMQALDRAIGQDGQMFQAYHNRALVTFQQALAQNPEDTNAISDIERALSHDPEDRDMLYDAACIYALSSKSNPDHTEKALVYLQRAVRRGAPASANLTLFSHLRGDPRFEECLRASSTTASPKRQPTVVLPVTEARLP